MKAERVFVGKKLLRNDKKLRNCYEEKSTTEVVGEGGGLSDNDVSSFLKIQFFVCFWQVFDDSFKIWVYIFKSTDFKL